MNLERSDSLVHRTRSRTTPADEPDVNLGEKTLNYFDGENIEAQLQKGASCVFGPLAAESDVQIITTRLNQHMSKENFEQMTKKLKSLASIPKEDQQAETISGKKGRKWWRVYLPGPVIQVLVILALVFIIPAGFYGYSPAFKYLGFALYFARGPALAIMTLTGFLFFGMCKRTLGWIQTFDWIMRLKLVQTMVHENRTIHIWSAYYMVIFSLCHTFAHLFGTVPLITRYDKAFVGTFSPNLQRDIYYNDSDSPVIKYLWMCATQPAISGVLLLVVMFLMIGTSLQAVRTKNYELFWYTHHLFFIWFAFNVWHGSMCWFNWGFPLTVVFAGPGLILYLVERAISVRRAMTWKPTIVTGQISPNCTAGLLQVTKPKGFVYITGQYVYINCPEVNKMQWHPFSIASCNRNLYLDLLIGGTGGWATDLLKYIENCNKENKPYPAILMDGPFKAPAQESRFKKKIILIGAGVGIAPFFGFLDKQLCMMADKKKQKEDLDNLFTLNVQPSTEMEPKDRRDSPSSADTVSSPLPQPAKYRQDRNSVLSGFEEFEITHLYWINKNYDEMLWIRNSLMLLLTSPHCFAKRVYVHLHLTAPMDSHNRDTLLYLLGVQELLKDSKNLTISFQRPNIYEEMKEIVSGEQGGKSSGWKAYVCGPAAVSRAVQEAGKRIRKEGGDLTVYEELF